VLMERVGENGLSDLLRDANIEPVDATATREVHRPKQLAVGMNLDHPLFASGVEKSIDQPQRLEYLQGTRMNDGRSVPVERPGPGIYQMAWHPSTGKLRSKQQARWPRTDNQHDSLTACHWIHRRKCGSGT
jgi:hypothetical protein